MDAKVYVISKIKYAEMWRELRDKVNIISSWIDIENDTLISNPDLLTKMWSTFIEEASTCTHAIIYGESEEQLKGGLVELGAALAGGATVYVIGHVPELRTVQFHPRIHLESSISEVLKKIQTYHEERIESTENH